MAAARSSCSMIAGIAIWDAEKNVTLTQDLTQHGSNHTPYEGMKVTGWPRPWFAALS
jgi:dihydroorotase-like cyclic amidohydrolase